ncbi:MAG: MBL fold metallo-hydrolase [Actinomycetota bacterium]|nr:MBL fold metallo-hydrolase [Actinomycetota bacterium]
MSREIDVRHLGRAHVICAHEVDGVIVDPGPASCADTLLEALDEAPRALLLTHIHLDHAGAAGVLARTFPSLTVYVHERGAPHLIDPSRLLRSAERLYGDQMERLWGEVASVPAERVQALGGGETVEGMRVEYTPGHASHHVSYLHEDSGEAFVGDVAGVRVPGSTYTVAPTPPPDIDVEAWLGSLETVGEWRPAALCLTHFGCHRDVDEQLERLRDGLLERAEQARTMEPDEFAGWSEAQTRAAVDGETADALIQAAPPETLGMGLRRYWEKKVS